MTPPLPKAMIHPEAWAGGYYTKAQITLYANACIDQERERCAQVCDDLQETWLNEPAPTRPGYVCADAIRSGT